MHHPCKAGPFRAHFVVNIRPASKTSAWDYFYRLMTEMTENITQHLIWGELNYKAFDYIYQILLYTVTFINFSSCSGFSWEYGVFLIISTSLVNLLYPHIWHRQFWKSPLNLKLFKLNTLHVNKAMWYLTDLFAVISRTLSNTVQLLCHGSRFNLTLKPYFMWTSGTICLILITSSAATRISTSSSLLSWWRYGTFESLRLLSVRQERKTL